MSINGLLIDPDAKTITDVTVVKGSGTLQDLHDLLGCRAVEAMPFVAESPEDSPPAVLYCDDEGGCKDQPGFTIVGEGGCKDQPGFTIVTLSETLTDRIIFRSFVAGKAALFGPIDDNGNVTDTTLTATEALAAMHGYRGKLLEKDVWGDCPTKHSALLR